jgi:hypothetical protein
LGVTDFFARPSSRHSPTRSGSREAKTLCSPGTWPFGHAKTIHRTSL